jgi:acetylglutamate kinase
MNTNLYYAEFADEIFVIQAEAEAVENSILTRTILRGIRDLLTNGIRVALVFGKGDGFKRELCTRFGARQHPETNRLIVPEHALPRMQQERQRIANEIAEFCESVDIPFSMLPETAIRAERRIGHESTGIVTGIDLAAIRTVLDDRRVAVIGFGGWDDHQQFLHVPSVSLAADLAVELRARKLMLLTHIDGIFVPGRKGGLQQLSFADMEELLCVLPRRDANGNPLVAEAMVPKIHASIRAVAGGVSQVHLVSYSQMLEEILTRTGVGTMIERQQSHHVDYAQPEDLDEIDRLHQESQRYTTVYGTPLVRPLDRAALERLLPQHAGAQPPRHPDRQAACDRTARGAADPVDQRLCDRREPPGFAARSVAVDRDLGASARTRLHGRRRDHRVGSRETPVPAQRRNRRHPRHLADAAPVQVPPTLPPRRTRHGATVRVPVVMLQEE